MRSRMPNATRLLQAGALGRRNCCNLVLPGGACNSFPGTPVYSGKANEGAATRQRDAGMCLAAERDPASPFSWRARQNIPSLAKVRTLKRRKRRAPNVPGSSRALNTYEAGAPRICALLPMLMILREGQ